MVILGIDIGTTKSAAVICENGRLLAHAACANDAGYGTQSMGKLIQATAAAVTALPEDLRRRVSAIGMTGQMHGVAVWNGNRCSDLENWQSTLALDSGTLEWIKGLPGCEKLASGFGFATLAVPGWTEGYSHAATVMDYFACLLTERKKPVTDATNAASWGLWCLEKQDWDREAVRALGIAESMLPEIVPAGTPVGGLCLTWAEKLGLNGGIPVYAAIGDNPAAILGSCGDIAADIYLTVGTGAQLAVVLADDESEICGNMELRPFPGGRTLAVSASLCGGKSLELLALFIRDVLRQFDVDVPMKTVYDKISAETDSAERLSVNTSFMGERHAPLMRGSIADIDMENLRFHPLCRAWCEGILAGLLAGMPSAVLNRRKRVVVNGNAVRKTPLFMQVIRERFPGMEVVMPDLCEEAACGAVMSVVYSAGSGR